MAPSTPRRLDRVTASVVLATLFGGVGALGWLLGHVATYDAIGQQHDHATHGYMQPLQQGGVLVATVGVLLAILAVLLGRNAVTRWVDDWRRSGSVLPWIAAAVAPAAAFLLVEYVEGSIASRGLGLLVTGLPLQAVIGLFALALVRMLLTVLVRVADRLAGRLHVRPLRAQRSPARAVTFIHSPRVAPMASNAALRAPPRHMP